MRRRLYSLMFHYAQLCKNSQYPSPTETLARRMQDAADAAAAGDRLRREGEQVRLVHRASLNAHYEGALGTRPSSYGNSGLYHFNPVLVGAYDLLPSQPCVCVCVFVMVIGGSSEVRASASEKGSTEKNRAKPHLAISSASDTVLKHGWISAPCLAATWRNKKVYNHSIVLT